jgi:hypothetical protein
VSVDTSGLGVNRVKDEIATAAGGKVITRRVPARQSGECPKVTTEVRHAIMEIVQAGKSVSAISRLVKLSRPTLPCVTREAQNERRGLDIERCCLRP